MGGTFMRLQQQGHEVHVAYQTSGNIAVADDEALRFARFIVDYNDKFGIKSIEAERIYKKSFTFLENKKSSEIDIPEVLNLKGLIRKGEARSSSNFVGLADKQIHFMGLHFMKQELSRKIL